MLNSIGIKNFKSFKDFHIELDHFNCIVAPNNAGKSNLIEAIEFLGYAISDPDKAMEEFGGFNSIKNIFLDEECIEFSIRFEVSDLYLRDNYLTDRELQDKISEELWEDIDISIEIDISKEYWQSRFIIGGKYGCGYGSIEKIDQTSDAKNRIETYPFLVEIVYTNSRDISKHNKTERYLSDKLPTIERFEATKNREELKSYFGAISSDRICHNYRLDRYLFSYKLYPNEIKTSLKGGRELRRDGLNLVSVLKYLKDNHPNEFEMISTSLVGIVEELGGVEIDRDTIGRDMILFEEKSRLLPIGIISDGTIALLSTVTAIFEPNRKNMISFDEIENHLHLKAINYLLGILKEQSYQTLFTTQSSEIFNNLDLEKDNLIFLYRDYDGFTKALNSKMVPNFREEIARYSDISTIIESDLFGYLGDYDETKE